MYVDGDVIVFVLEYIQKVPLLWNLILYPKLEDLDTILPWFVNELGLTQAVTVRLPVIPKPVPARQ